jgi:signal transduction histidine kinase
MMQTSHSGDQVSRPEDVALAAKPVRPAAKPAASAVPAVVAVVLAATVAVLWAGVGRGAASLPLAGAALLAAAAAGAIVARAVGAPGVGHAAHGTHATRATHAAHASPASMGVRPPSGAAPQRGGPDRAFVGVARRIQGTVNVQLHDLREMQDRHGGEPEVFGDLLRLDHGASMIGRLADSLAVLGGAPPGRSWARPVDVLGVVRGAMSRIADYPRVDAEVPSDVGVAAAAVEPVVHALAELLDNATRYSPPDTRVLVTATRSPDGLVIAVEDSGVGLSDATQSRIGRVLAGVSADEAALASLTVDPEGPPHLGLAVVGRLARANGFGVAVVARDDRGVRALVRLPAALVAVPGAMAAEAEVEPSADPGAQIPRLPRRRQPTESEPESIGANGLPQRRRAPLPESATLLPPEHESGGAQSASQPGAGLWLSAFLNGKDDTRQ